MNRVAFLVLATMSIGCLLDSPLMANPPATAQIAEEKPADAPPNDTASQKEEGRTHQSSVRSEPDRFTDVEERYFRIGRSDMDSAEWMAAIKCALSHQSGRGHYTLMRVIVNDADAKETIQAQGLKLKELTEQYHGGGGTYRVLQSGGFVFIEHIQSKARHDGRDPITLGTNSFGKVKLWVDVPANGVLGVVGDVILSHRPDEETGILSIRVETDAPSQQMKVAIGSVVVGGEYGDTYEFDTDRGFRLRLASGNYKLHLPQFDRKTSRWDFEIESKSVTRLTFTVNGQTVEKTEENKIRIRKSGNGSDGGPAAPATPE